MGCEYFSQPISIPAYDYKRYYTSHSTDYYKSGKSRRDLCTETIYFDCSAVRSTWQQVQQQIPIYWVSWFLFALIRVEKGTFSILFGTYFALFHSKARLIHLFVSYKTAKWSATYFSAAQTAAKESAETDLGELILFLKTSNMNQ